MQTLEIAPIGAPRVWLTKAELEAKPIADLTWDATVEELLACSHPMLKGWIKGLNDQDMLQRRARVFKRGGRYFGVVYMVGDDRWQILPLCCWPRATKPILNVVR